MRLRRNISGALLVWGRERRARLGTLVRARRLGRSPGSAGGSSARQPPENAGVPPARPAPAMRTRWPRCHRFPGHFVIRAAQAARRLGPLCLLALLGAACNAGAYPVDIFPEMHYAPAYRRLQPERLPPPGAVPITGGKPTYTFAQAGGLANPVPATADTLAAAKATYGVNCAMCHGADGHGDSPVAAYFRAAGVVPPVDFASPRVRGRSDGQLYWLVTNGIGNMPPFRDLLTDEQVWSLVDYIRSVQGP